ncbi:skin secretory protein xP2-like [Amphibalanus amphitrite]|uniref:skin secretory protein xP2-like n=1 Tax=Amphibalanus amphitrite TaxID=1232801 RepID=UPI001C8FB1AA|nr:skin secretory protein xP2-like [Amphibalanus amphitrite]
MANPDSWVRSGYSVFWSRPGAGSHDYQPLGATRRPRPRRLRGWQPLAVLLVLAVLGLSTLGLVAHRPAASLGVRKGSSGVRMALSGEGEGDVATQGEAHGPVDVSGPMEAPGPISDSEGSEKQSPAPGDGERHQPEGGRPAARAAEQLAPPAERGRPQPTETAQERRPDGDAGGESGTTSTDKEAGPREVLVVLGSPAAGDTTLDASGNASPVQGD